MSEDMEQRIGEKLDDIHGRITDMGREVTEIKTQFLARGGFVDRLEKAEQEIEDSKTFKARVVAIAGTVATLAGVITGGIMKFFGGDK